MKNYFVMALVAVDGTYLFGNIFRTRHGCSTS